MLVFTAGVLCIESALLQDTARANRADSLILKVHAQVVRGVRRLHGASDLDTPMILSLITEVAVCGDCIAYKAGITHWRVGEALNRIRGIVQIDTKVARCDACLKTTVVHGLR